MRLLLATASLAISVALLAGCSSSPQGASALPGSPGSQQSAGYFGLRDASGHMSGTKLLKLQSEGKIPGPVPQKVLKWQYRQVQAHARPVYHISSNWNAVAAWASVTDFGYLVGQNGSLAKTVADIDVNNFCYYPVTVKVDSARNIWTACEYNSAFTGGQVQEFSKNGTARGSYTWNASCTNPSGCVLYGGYGFDSAETSTAVFAPANTYQIYCPTSSSCVETTTAGFVYWTGGPSSTPTFITLPSATGSINYEVVYYMDVNAQGNIYFDYYGCENTAPYSCGYGLAEIRKPTKPSYTVIPLLAPGSIQFPGGVYVSGRGYALNVTDQLLRTTSRYHLPMSPSSSPFRTLGPTVPNYFGLGDPVSGGFNPSDSRFGLGDAYGWIDVGRVYRMNQWRNVATTSCPFGCEGFAFTPSDK